MEKGCELRSVMNEGETTQGTSEMEGVITSDVVLGDKHGIKAQNAKYEVLFLMTEGPV